MEHNKIDINTNFKKPQPTSLDVQELNYTVKLKNNSEFQILNQISTKFCAGEVTGILGPVGAGKTSLLNILGKRTTVGVDGNILINNGLLKKKHKNLIGYVLQKDYFFSTLSVIDTLLYTAHLRRGDLSFAQKKNLVNEIILQLRLQNAKTTKIGDPFHHGVSGGELKRVNIATELISNPSIFLLDEPTSGLDSSSTIGILETLQQLAHLFKLNIILSIHQPSSQAFELLDKIILLAEGQLLYQGPTNQLIYYLNFIGYKTPIGWNVSDYVVELLENNNIFEKMKENYIKYIKKHENGSYYMAIGEHITSILPKAPISNFIKQLSENSNQITINNINNESQICVEEPLYEELKLNNFKMPSWIYTSCKLIHRGMKKDSKGDNIFYLFIQAIFISIIMGLIWFQKLNIYEEELVEDRIGFLFSAMTYWMFLSGFVGLLSFIADRAIIAKERSCKTFGISSYLFSKTISDISIYSVLPFLFTFITVPMIGIQFNAKQIFALIGTYLLTLFVSHSVGMCIASIFTRYQSSLLALTVFSIVCMLTAGYYVDYESVPIWLKWIRYISTVNYTVSIEIYANFNNKLFICKQDTLSTVCPIPGSVAMEPMVTGLGPFLDVVCLLGIFIITKTITYFNLRFTKQLKLQ